MYRICLLLFRLSIAGLFLYASYSKIADPAAFATAVFNYRMLPDLAIHAVALLVPWIEMLCACLLLAACWRSEAYAWLALLDVVFIVAQTQALVRGLDIECGCFGVDHTSPLTIGKVLSNWVILVILILLLSLDRKPRQVDRRG